MTSFLAQAVLVVWVVLEVTLRSGESAKSWETSSEDRSTTRLIVLAYLGLVVLSIVVRGTGHVTTNSTLAWIALAVAAAGLALRFWAMRHLGRFYSRTLRVEDDQHVVDDGPYRYVRHPGYLSSLMVWVGSRAAINIVVAVITLLVLGFVYARRIAAEEDMLDTALGERYESYRQQTWRLVPFLW